MGEKGDSMKQKFKPENDGITTINVPQLKQMATTKKLREILQNYIEHETIPSVRTAWIEYFLDIKNKKISIK
jgi:hypothetical protein